MSASTVSCGAGARTETERRAAHDLVDVSDGRELINVGLCQRCGMVGPLRRFRSMRLDTRALRAATPTTEGER